MNAKKHIFNNSSFADVEVIDQKPAKNTMVDIFKDINAQKKEQNKFWNKKTQPS